ncbi:MAG: cupredoxin domain-containing protein [Actinomycetota bacterium]
MDPEQIYQEVLAEEQQKGSAAPVAEGRAKAARSRAENGSPHPKEPKWWPGSQPHLEGGEGGGDEEAPAEEAAEEEPVEEPAAEEETAAEPAAEAAPEPEPAEQPAPAAPVPAEPVPAEQPAAAAAAPAAAATATRTIPTTGVSHGTASGNRMRPEDGVATAAQLDGQQAMYERRRLIDEVVKTGVPAAAASQRDNSSSGALAILYLLIPLLVIGFLAFAGDDTEPSSAEEGSGAPTEEAAPGGSEGSDTIVAVNTTFETEEISAEAGGTVSGTLENQDSVVHNIAFYESEDDISDPASARYTSDDADAGASVDFEFTAPEEPGDYPFVCDYHPTTMSGTLAVGEGGGGGSGGGGADQGGGG